MSERITENTRSGVRAAVWGWLVWYFTPFSGFLFTVLDKDIFSTLDPANIESFIVGTASALGITGGVGAYYRDKKSPTDYRPTQPQIRPVDRPAAHPVVEQPIAEPEYSPVRVMKSQYFQTHELECNGMECNCIFPGMSKFTMDVADAVREKFGPIKATSAYRCKIHNATIPGAASDSWHTRGAAIDMKPLAVGVTAKMVYDFLDKKYTNRFGIGHYNSFVHFDDRPAFYARKESPNSSWYQRRVPDLILS